MRILQVNSSDRQGGAEKVSWMLHRAYRETGHESWLVVGRKRGDDPNVVQLDNLGRKRGVGLVKVLAEKLLGWQYLSYPGSHRLLESLGRAFDILHLHNLHGGYVDLAALPMLSRRIPTVVTLHDMWLMTGHCAQPMECERWKAGCGDCPDLAIYPGIPRDGTRFNWRRKKRLLEEARLHLAAPSRWMHGRVMGSEGILRGFPVTVVPNGVGVERFSPDSKADARRRLEVPPDRRLFLLFSNDPLRSHFKDIPFLWASIRRLMERVPADRRPMLMVVGGRGNSSEALPADLRSYLVQRPFESEEERVVDCYRAADLMVYPSKADTCPLVLMEAAACGLPVAATSVGGIPELVEEGKTGWLVPLGDVERFAEVLDRFLLLDEDTVRAMGEHARRLACERFDFQGQVRSYLDLYRRLTAERDVTLASGGLHVASVGASNS
jgi:glycosyltransferase involved in cell wall biosynthesis